MPQKYTNGQVDKLNFVIQVLVRIALVSKRHFFYVKDSPDCPEDIERKLFSFLM